MTAERAQVDTTQDQLPTENIHHLKSKLLSHWQQLPAEHKATMTLLLLNEVRQGEWGEWLTEAGGMLLKDREKEPSQHSYPVISISRAGLSQIFSQEEVALFSDDDVQLIAQSIGTSLNLNPSFWNTVEATGRLLLENHHTIADHTSTIYQVRPDPESQDGEADFSQWMLEVDRFVWMISGCSIHDLPNHDFRTMFEDGASPAEIANEALQEAGFTFFE